MHPLVRLALVAVVSWQALAAGRGLVVRSGSAPGVDFPFALTATTDQRLRHALGDDAHLIEELRRVVPPGLVLLNQQVVATLDGLRATTRSEAELVAEFTRLSAQNGLFIQLTTLLFPSPFLLSVPAPIELAEQEAAAGRERWLFVLQGNAEPRDRAGWSCVHRAPRFSLWRFPKGS